MEFGNFGQRLIRVDQGMLRMSELEFAALPQMIAVHRRP